MKQHNGSLKPQNVSEKVWYYEPHFYSDKAVLKFYVNADRNSESPIQFNVSLRKLKASLKRIYSKPAKRSKAKEKP